MGKISANTAMEEYKGGSNEFFTLKDDGDTEVVRFLYDNEDDLDIYAVHEVEIGGKKRYVECLRTADCPLCVAGNRAKARMFLQMFVPKTSKVCTWERGTKFIPIILGLFNKYGALVNREFEIERHGKKGDTQTQYQLYAMDKDDQTLEDFPDKQDLEDGLILVKSAEEMKAIINGTYTEENDAPQGNNQQGGNHHTTRRRREPVNGSDVF